MSQHTLMRFLMFSMFFFALNGPNYARWEVLCLLQLKKSRESCMDILSEGAFTARCTAKNYARCAVDLTLEQTVNRDAASPNRGICALSQERTGNSQVVQFISSAWNSYCRIEEANWGAKCRKKHSLKIRVLE